MTGRPPEALRGVVRRGDRYYLDGLHRDHIEVFNANGQVRGVYNLGGTLNVEKTRQAIREGRTIDVS